MRRKPCKWFPEKVQATKAKTWRFPGAVWSEYYTLLCPLWLGEENGAPLLSNLKSIANEGDSFETLRMQIDRWGFGIRSATIYHETAHWQDISWPRCDGHELYEPEGIVSHAQYGGDDGYEFNLRNAHSWVSNFHQSYITLLLCFIAMIPRRFRSALISSYNHKTQHARNRLC